MLGIEFENTTEIQNISFAIFFWPKTTLYAMMVVERGGVYRIIKTKLLQICRGNFETVLWWNMCQEWNVSSQGQQICLLLLKNRGLIFNVQKESVQMCFVLLVLNSWEFNKYLDIMVSPFEAYPGKKKARSYDRRRT